MLPPFKRQFKLEDLEEGKITVVVLLTTEEVKCVGVKVWLQLVVKMDNGKTRFKVISLTLSR